MDTGNRKSPTIVEGDPQADAEDLDLPALDHLLNDDGESEQITDSEGTV